MSCISIDLLDNRIVLSGDIQDLLKNKFATRYIKDNFCPLIEDENFIIPLNGKDVEKALTDMLAAFDKYGFKKTISNNAQAKLNKFFEEEERFKDFSLKALDIRNNRCDTDEFKEFTASVKANMKNRILYPLQLLSAYHLAFAQNACNFSVPGAGKTSIVYGAYAFLRNNTDLNRKVDKLLIISPLNAFVAWEDEYKECFGEYPSVKRLLSSESKRDKENYLYSTKTSEITLVSYASVISLKESLSFFLEKNNVMIVLDEAHKIKNNSGGIIAESVLKLSKHGKSRVILTGTPAPNGYEDLYNMFKFIWPSKNVIGYHPNQLQVMTKNTNDRRIADLISKISPFFIRIRKSDLKIPKAINNEPIIVEMGKEQRLLYDFIEKKYIEELMTQDKTSSTFRNHLLKAKTIRLMQAATNPSMLEYPLREFLEDEDTPAFELESSFDDTNIFSRIKRYKDTETPAKFVETKKLVKKILSDGGKVVIWTTFIQTIKDLKEYLEADGIKTEELYGAIPVEGNSNENAEEREEKTREKIVREFKDANSSFKVIIANPFAVAESISLHKACHNAIYLERTFNAAHFMQSKDRIHRYGLKPDDVTNYYFILSEKSVDEVIHDRLNDKERRLLEILEKEEIPLFANASDDFVEESDIRALIDEYIRKTTAN